MYKLGAIGEKEKIVFLKALGLEIFPVEKDEDVETVFEEIKKRGNFGIVLVDEKYSKRLKEEEKKFPEELPVIASLPLGYIPASLYKEEMSPELKDIIKKAVGTDKIMIR